MTRKPETPFSNSGPGDREWALDEDTFYPVFSLAAGAGLLALFGWTVLIQGVDPDGRARLLYACAFFLWVAVPVWRSLHVRGFRAALANRVPAVELRDDVLRIALFGAFGGFLGVAEIARADLASGDPVRAARRAWWLNWRLYRNGDRWPRDLRIRLRPGAAPRLATPGGVRLRGEKLDRAASCVIETDDIHVFRLPGISGDPNETATAINAWADASGNSGPAR